MPSETNSACALTTALAGGAPRSRLVMHHEPTMDVAVSGWVADQVACAARGWGVAVSVAGVVQLAEGTAQVVATAEADRFDWLSCTARQRLADGPSTPCDV